MKLIGFTTEERLPDEEKLIEMVLDCGLDYIHIRKPLWSEAEMVSLLSSISPRYYRSEERREGKSVG